TRFAAGAVVDLTNHAHSVQVPWELSLFFLPISSAYYISAGQWQDFFRVFSFALVTSQEADGCMPSLFLKFLFSDNIFHLEEMIQNHAKLGQRIERAFEAPLNPNNLKDQALQTFAGYLHLTIVSYCLPGRK